MSTTKQTFITPLQIRQRRVSANDIRQEQHSSWESYQEIPPKHSLMKNLAVASALVLCAATLRSGAVPQLNNTADAVLAAATDNSLLDEQLGKLSFVSTLFPEAVLVFGESHIPTLTMPVSGGTVIQAWSEQEPYIEICTETSLVVSAMAGEVSGIYHGNGDEKLVQITNQEGISCLYGNLYDVDVIVGDAVEEGRRLGITLPGENLIFEVRCNGISVDPARYFPQ